MHTVTLYCKRSGKYGYVCEFLQNDIVYTFFEYSNSVHLFRTSYCVVL